MPPKPVEPKNLSHVQLLNAFLKPNPEKNIIDEMRFRSGGSLPYRNDSVVKDLVVPFLEHIAVLKSHSRLYTGTVFKEAPLSPIDQILAPKKLFAVCNPFTGTILGSDGSDPETGVVFPVSDTEKIQRICWLSEDLARLLKHLYVPSDIDLQEKCVLEVSAGNYTGNIRGSLIAYKNASAEQKEAAFKRMTPEYWELRQIGRSALEPFREKEVELPSEPITPIAKTIYCMYSVKDRRYRDAIRVNLAHAIRENRLIFRDAEDIRAGAERKLVLENWVSSSDMILCLLSADFHVDPDCVEIYNYVKRYPKKFYLGVVCRASLISENLPFSKDRGNLLPTDNSRLSDDIDTQSFRVATDILRSLGLQQ